MQQSNSIKPIQLAFIIFITQTGIGVIMLPTELARTTGHDGWIVVFITGFLAMLLGGLALTFLRRYRDKSIYDINQLLFGKGLGIGMNSILILYLLTTAVVGLSIFAFFIRVTLLPLTPQWALSPFIMLPSFYLVWQGLKDMARYLVVSMLNYVIIALLPFLLLKEAHWSFLLPVAEAELTNILQSIQPTFFAFIGFELILFFYPYVTERQKMARWYIGATFTTMIFYLVYVVLSTIVLGENFLTFFVMPFFNISRLYRAPIFERLDLYIIALWYIPMACSVRHYVFACLDGLQRVYRLRKSKLLYVLYFLAISLLSNLADSVSRLRLAIMIINYAGMGVIGFMVLCLLFSFIRRKGVQVN